MEVLKKCVPLPGMFGWQRRAGLALFIFLYSLAVLAAPALAQSDIRVTGRGGTIVLNGTHSPSLSNGTEFPRTDIYRTSYRTFTIHNDGPSPLTITSIGRSGGYFSLDGEMPTIVDPYGQAEFRVAATPLARGNWRGGITIHTNDPDESPYFFHVGVEGDNEPAVVDAGADQSVDYGDTVTLDATITPPAEPGRTITYAWAQISGEPVTLTGTDTLTPSFVAPTLIGGTPHDVVFELTANDEIFTRSDTVTVTISRSPGPEIGVTGNGVAIVDGDTTPNAADNTLFGTVWPLRSISKSFVIRNNGLAPLDIFGIAVSGAEAGDFSIEGETRGFILPGGQRTITVEATAQGYGHRTATLTIISSDAQHQIFDFVIEITGRLNSDVGEDITVISGDVVTLQGTGAPTLTPDHPINATPNVSWFQYLPGVTSPVLSERRTMTPSFTAPTLAIGAEPLQLGFRMDVRHDGVYDVDSLIVTVLPPTLPGILVLGARRINNGDMTPRLADHSRFIATYALGGTTERTFRIQNIGRAPLTISSIDVVPQNAGEFVLVSAPTTVAAGGEGTFTVRFAPQQAALGTAIVTINSDAPDDPAYTFMIDGVGRNIAPTAIAGPEQTVPSGMAVTLSGNGAADLANGTNEPLQPVTLTWRQVSGPSVTFSSPTTVTQNGTASLNPSFTAPILETNDAPVALEFELTADDGLTTTSSRTGVWVNPPEPTIGLRGNGQVIANGDTTPSTADHTDFGSTFPNGGTVVRTFTIQNTGPGDLVIHGIDLLGVFGSEFVISEAPTDIAAGASADLVMSFTPSGDLGARTAEMHIRSTDPINGTYAVRLSGQAADQAPTATAGTAQVVVSGAPVVLDGSASSANDAGQGLSYSWVETSGTGVVLTGADTATPSFTAPLLAPGAADVALSFQLTVDDGLATATDSVTITVAAPLAITIDAPIAGDDVVNADEAGAVTVSGTVLGNAGGQGVTVVVSDGTAQVSGTATVVSGVWSTVLDLSVLSDGVLNVTADASNLAGASAPQAEVEVSKDASAPAVILTGPEGPVSDPFTLSIEFSEPVSGFDAGDLTLVNATVSDLTGSGATYGVTVTPERDGTVEVSIAAAVALDSGGNANAASNGFVIEAALTGVPDPVPAPDADGDGVPDGYESGTADRDGDGIPDAQDYDPQGYFYCEDDGRILPGGGITVSGPSGSNSAVGTRNDIRIVRDGSSGEYQWFALRPGLYSVTYHYPAGSGVPSTTRLSAGTLDVTTLLPANPAVLGSTEVGSSGVLSDAGLAANPAFYAAFDIAAGDPHVLGNNIPMTLCAENAVRIDQDADGAEANGGVPLNPGFVVSQGRPASVDTVVAYGVTGTANAGEDFAPLSGSVTIPAGQTSARIEVAVLEDGAIEGSETIVITLGAIASGDAATRLAADPDALTARAVIADDDLADVVVADLDLTATEGRPDDTARMSFALAGAPSSEVVLSFSGDGQCTVAPATLRFDGADYGTAQLLTITAIDDDEAEGSHSCQPSVTIRSDDARFDGVAVSLSPVTIADDLVDTVRTPLTEVLQSDFERAVGQQSLRFSRIARGALERLQAGLDESHCGTLEPFDVDGNLEFGLEGGQSAGDFHADFLSCQTGVRHITDGSFSVSMTPDLGWQWMLGFSVQQERQRNGTELRGRFWGGYLSRNDAGNQAEGRIDGIGLNGGIYGARAFSNGLFLDYYAAAAIGYHRFGLSFDDPAGPIRAEGSYRYAGLFGGAALSGETQVGAVLVAPRIGLDLAYARAGDATVTASRLGIRDTGVIALQPVNGLRAFVETRLTLNAGTLSEGERPQGMTVEIAPRLFCERGLGNDDAACGLGGSLRLSNADPDSDVSYELILDAERAGDVSQASLEFSRERRILDGAGTVATGLTLDHTGRARANIRLDLRF